MTPAAAKLYTDQTALEHAVSVAINRFHSEQPELAVEQLWLLRPREGGVKCHAHIIGRAQILPAQQPAA